jgi:hypothetical protein
MAGWGLPDGRVRSVAAAGTLIPLLVLSVADRRSGT